MTRPVLLDEAQSLVPQHGDSARSLKSGAARSVRWSALSQAGRQIVQLLTTVILARLLAPAEHGLMGMALVITGFIEVFKDLGTSAAVIQRAEASSSFLSSIFWANAVFGVATGALVYGIAPLAAGFYGEARIEPLLKVLSIGFAVSGIGILQKTLLERQLQFDRLAFVEIVSMAIGAVSAVCAALSGWGVWSLVCQSLAVALASTILLWTVSSWRPRWSFDVAQLRAASHYSLHLAGFNVFNYFSRNGDYLLIGKFFGPTELGYYTLAYRIMLYPLQTISTVVTRVMFPLYSRIQNDNARLRDAHLQVCSLIAVVTFPLMFALFALAKPLVAMVFGARWNPIIPLLMIFAPIGMIQSMGTTVGSIYQAKGRTDWLFWWGITSGALAMLSFVVGLRWGILGVASAYGIVSLIMAYPCFAIPFRLIGLHVRDLLLAVSRPLLCGFFMAGALLSIRLLFESELYRLGPFVAIVVAGTGVYALASWLLNREQVRELVQVAGVRL